MIQGSRQLLMVYERLRASAIKWEHSKGPIPYGMTVLKDKGMLSVCVNLKVPHSFN
jgi:hypothetical protein